MASPLGAVANGVDLLGEIGGAGEQELALIRSSSGRAATMMRVLRLAFGTARDDGSAVERADLAADLGEMISSRRMSVAVDGQDGPALAMPDARLVALMAMSGRALLGLSGRIEIALPTSAALPAILTASGPAAEVSPERASWLAGDVATSLPEPREIELALLPLAARAAGAEVVAGGAGGQVTLRASPAG